ncbi:MAG: hypothetical protein JO131_08520, partial [Gammaproteobacteria bacterium]|nr:hypothetical protein [Gammaproteobacteria bacterium]
MQNKDFLANNILEIVTNPRTTSEPQNKEKLEKINEQLESTIGNLNNQNNTMKKAPTLLAMTQGQTEGLSLKSEIKEGLDKVVTSNISAANLGNKAAMYTSLLLGQATSKDKTVYLAVKPAIDNA